jgi:hypothetical protein
MTINGDPGKTSEATVIGCFNFPRETKKGARGSVVVKALSYKPEGRGIASR